MNICTTGNCICDAREWDGDTDCFGNTAEDDARILRAEAKSHLGLSPYAGAMNKMENDPMKIRRILTGGESSTYNAMKSRGFSHDEALDAALDGVSVDTIREMYPLPRQRASAVSKAIVLEPTGKWFIAEPRKYENDEDYWYCIHGGTTSTKNLASSLEYQKRSKISGGREVFVFEARNRTQVNDWLTARGHITNFNGTRSSAMNARDRRIKQAELAIQRAQAEIDRVLRLPEEPVGEGDFPPIIHFVKRFRGNNPYTYAAVKVNNRWHTTGGQNLSFSSWDQLIDWILSEGDENATIYSVKKFKSITA